MCNVWYKRLVVIGLVYCSFSSAFAYVGSGTEEDPYQIATIGDLTYLTSDSGNWDKHFILTANLFKNYIPLTPIGDSTTNFTGVFNGNGHIISRAALGTWPSTDYVGVFGVIGADGQINNLGVDANVYGNNYIGALAGENRGTITDCYTTSEVRGNTYSGGLVGRNFGTITKCYSLAMVMWGYGYPSEEHRYAGGLVGSNHGTITDCYARGSVRGKTDIGGLVGENLGGSITNSYATGSVTGESGGSNVGGLVGYHDGTLTTCFWDIVASGTTDGVGNIDPDPLGAMGKTTAEMKTASTFVDAGWDFINTWAICQGTNYPQLIWQIPAADFLCPDGVNYYDFAFFANHWMDSTCSDPTWCEGTDLDKNGIVDFADIAIFAEEWLKGI